MKFNRSNFDETVYIKMPCLGDPGRYVDSHGNLYEMKGCFQNREFLCQVKNFEEFKNKYSSFGFSEIKIRA